MPVVDILCPTARKWDPEQCFAFTHVAIHAAACGVLRTIRYRKWLYIDQARNDLVAEVLDRPGATHVLFLDDDMVWPANLLVKLLGHNVPVVGATYFTRTPPHDVVCGDLDGTTARNWQRLPVGLEEVGWVGAGALLVEVAVLQRMREDWFHSNQCGEDVQFCRRLRDMGIPVYVDGGTVCGHVTDQVITEEHWKHFHRGSV
jgi:hypothetical protein